VSSNARASQSTGATRFGADDTPNRRKVIEAGAIRGLVGGVCIWIYEAIVWVWAQHQMPLIGIPGNATGLVVGKEAQQALGSFSYLLGTAIHFFFCVVWGIFFAAVWAVMHLAIVIVSTNHPDYLDPNVIVGGLMSHIFFAVPLALIVKQRLA
jgi:hypothetical protein